MNNVVPLRPPEPRWLPIVLGVPEPRECCRCGQPVDSGPYFVEAEVGGRRLAVCRPCSATDPELAIWGEFAAVAARIDGLLQHAATRDQRHLLARMVADSSDMFSRWRWPEEDDDA